MSISPISFAFENCFTMHPGDEMIDALSSYETGESLTFNQNPQGVIKQKLLRGFQLKMFSGDYFNSENRYLLEATTDYNLTKIILENGANPNIYNPNLKSPLYNAISKNKLDTAFLLLENGALNTGIYDTPRDLLERNGTEEAKRLIVLLDQNEKRYVSGDEGFGRKRRAFEAGLIQKSVRFK